MFAKFNMKLDNRASDDELMCDFNLDDDLGNCEYALYEDHKRIEAQPMSA